MIDDDLKEGLTMTDTDFSLAPGKRLLRGMLFGAVTSLVAVLPAPGGAEGLPLGPVAVPVPAQILIRGQTPGSTMASSQVPRPLFLQERPAPSLRLHAGARTLPTR